VRARNLGMMQPPSGGMIRSERRVTIEQIDGDGRIARYFGAAFVVRQFPCSRTDSR
jgi:hypothetical protein